MRRTVVCRRAKRLWTGLALLIAVASAPIAAGSGPTRAAVVVETLHQVLAEHLRAPARGFETRLKRLQPVVTGSFDFEAITRVALGSAFAGLDDAARARFTQIIRRLSALTYADRFTAGDAAVRFVTLSEQPARRGRVLVRTRLERDDGEPVTLDYVLVDTSRGPRIVNVLANGVSDLSLKRAEYAAVIRKEGVAGLERRLMEQADELAAQGEGEGGNQVPVQGTSS
jgi:phospholipid transport system substrate-binding protein